MKQQKTFERFRVDSGMEEVHSRRRRATESCQEGGISNACGIALWADHFFIADQGIDWGGGIPAIFLYFALVSLTSLPHPPSPPTTRCSR